MWKVIYNNSRYAFNHNKNYHHHLKYMTIVKRFKHDFKLHLNNDISNIKIMIKNKYVTINELSVNMNLTYPTIWLRDNCQCTECFHSGTQSRTINWELFDVNVKIKDIWIDDKNYNIKIIWTDGHESIYNLQWLRERDFSEKNRQTYLASMYRPTKHLWSKIDFDEALNYFEFNDILNEDAALKEWLEKLTINGVAMIKNAPITEYECRKLANRVAFIRKTHYGEEFIVRSKDGTSNVAYLSTPLQLHTDLPYYEYKPGVNLLHCLVQSLSAGAFNLLTDGFYVAHRLHIEFPHFYKLLTETLVNWSDIGQENNIKFHSIYRAPVICLNNEQQLHRINYSVPQRDSYFTIPLEQVNDWYQAMAQFTKLLHEESVSFKTKPGDILTFDNIRLVHGRTGYTDINGNTRHIVGAYLDWDEIYSRLRVLKNV